MRISPHRHTLAVLRTTIGLTQKEMAQLAECARPTIQAIELGKLVLSERLAKLIAFKTGVDLTWLLKNKPQVPPVDGFGQPFEKRTFEEAQAGPEQKHPGLEFNQARFGMGINEARLAAVLLRALKDSKGNLCAYKLSKALDELEKEFGVTDEDRRDVGTARWLKAHPKITPSEAYQKAIQAVYEKKKKNPYVPKFNRALIQPDGQMIYTTDEPNPERDAAHLESIKKYLAKKNNPTPPPAKKPSTPGRKR